MKLPLPVLTVTFLAAASLAIDNLPVHAQPNTSSKVIIKPKPLPGGKLGELGGLRKAEPTGARYRLHISLEPKTTAEDDYSFDAYGTLKINGDTWWEMPRATSNKGPQHFINIFVPNNVSTSQKAMEYGYSFTKNNAFNQGRKFEFDTYKDDPRTSILHIELKLYDADTPPGGRRDRDDLFGNFDFKVKLDKGASYYYFWKDGGGNGSDIFVYVEHVKDLFDSRGTTLPKVETKPVIVKPEIVIKGPGPVIKKAPIVR
jgi:hypothetical protein